MRMIVTDSTNGRFRGTEFDSEDDPIRLEDDVFLDVEKTMELPDGIRFISSSFIIDAKEV